MIDESGFTRQSDLVARQLRVHALHDAGRHADAAELGQMLIDEFEVVDPAIVVATAESYERSSRVARALRLLDRFIAQSPDDETFSTLRATLVERLTTSLDEGADPAKPRMTSAETQPTQVVTESVPKGPVAVEWGYVLAGLLVGMGAALVALALL